jgi:DNA-binding LacI/PurR family transcriptional regulator
MQDHGPWKVVTGNHSYREMETVVIDHAWHGDAALLFQATEAELEAFRRRGMAVVLTSSEGPDGGFPRVVPDNRAIGALAAGHLIECGLEHFAYLGRGEILYREEVFAPGPRHYPVERLEGYRSVLSGHSHEPLAHFLSGHRLWRKQEITYVRMADLSRLLRRPELSLAKIAAHMGFPSTHELSRFCRTHSGLRPGALRNTR